MTVEYSNDIDVFLETLSLEDRVLLTIELSISVGNFCFYNNHCIMIYNFFNSINNLDLEIIFQKIFINLDMSDEYYNNYFSQVDRNTKIALLIVFSSEYFEKFFPYDFKFDTDQSWSIENLKIYLQNYCSQHHSFNQSNPNFFIEYFTQKLITLQTR